MLFLLWLAIAAIGAFVAYAGYDNKSTKVGNWGVFILGISAIAGAIIGAVLTNTWVVRDCYPYCHP